MFFKAILGLGVWADLFETFRLSQFDHQILRNGTCWKKNLKTTNQRRTERQRNLHSPETSATHAAIDPLDRRRWLLRHNWSHRSCIKELFSERTNPMLTWFRQKSVETNLWQNATAMMHNNLFSPPYLARKQSVYRDPGSEDLFVSYSVPKLLRFRSSEDQFISTFFAFRNCFLE